MDECISASFTSAVAFKISAERVGNDIGSEFERIGSLLFGQTGTFPGVADIPLVIENDPSAVILDSESACSGVMEECGSAVGEVEGRGVNGVIVCDIDQFMVWQDALDHISETAVEASAGVIRKDHTTIFQEVLIKLFDFRRGKIDGASAGKVNEGRFFAFPSLFFL